MVWPLALWPEEAWPVRLCPEETLGNDTQVGEIRRVGYRPVSVADRMPSFA